MQSINSSKVYCKLKINVNVPAAPSVLIVAKCIVNLIVSLMFSYVQQY